MLKQIIKLETVLWLSKANIVSCLFKLQNIFLISILRRKSLTVRTSVELTRKEQGRNIDSEPFSPDASRANPAQTQQEARISTSPTPPRGLPSLGNEGTSGRLCSVSSRHTDSVAVLCEQSRQPAEALPGSRRGRWPRYLHRGRLQTARLVRVCC